MSTTLTPAMKRSVLISMLRDKTTWPPRFLWDFRYPSCCGIGLLYRTFGNARYGDEETAHIASTLGISRAQVREVFHNPAWHLSTNSTAEVDAAYGEVTPEMVAARLEAVHRELAAG